MDETGAPRTMTWLEARALLDEKPGIEISSLSWVQRNKCIFKARAWVPVPGEGLLDSEIEAGCQGPVQKATVPMLWFLEEDGSVHEYRGSNRGEARADWIVGRSPGKVAAT